MNWVESLACKYRSTDREVRSLVGRNTISAVVPKIDHHILQRQLRRPSQASPVLAKAKTPRTAMTDNFIGPGLKPAHAAMNQVTIAELTTKLGEILRAVQNGESFEFVDRNRAIAEILPVRQDHAIRIRSPATDLRRRTKFLCPN
jgi:antitoxin (DNA-binding transcriptional repressor) of toxin-antitoxin stability system